jgi:hypothetical protein
MQPKAKTMKSSVTFFRKIPQLIVCVALSQTVFLSKASARVQRANDFVNSIGVTTHIRYNTLGYHTKYDRPNGGWRRLLIDSGIRHIRDELPGNPGKEDYWWPRINDLGANGIKSNLVINFSPYRNNRPRTDAEIESEIILQLGWLRKHLLSSTESIEALNEPQGFGWEKAFGKGRNGWIRRVRFYHQKLHEHTQKDSLLTRLPILGSAWGARWHFNATEVGNLSPYVDYGNFHPYPGGRAPEEVFTDNTFSAMRDRVQRYNYPNRPMLVTETGYHNSVNDRKTLHHYIPEDLEAIYAPRLFLEYFRLGFKRTYYYEFLDGVCNPKKDKVNDTFGMVDCNLNPKPTYYSIKNLITILNDKGSNFSPRNIEYSFAGDTSNLRHVLLQKTNGKYYMVVWRAMSVWDVDRKRRLPAPYKSLTLKLPKNRYVNPKYYFPNASANGVALPGSQGNVIQFPVDARVVVIEFAKR